MWKITYSIKHVGRDQGNYVKIENDWAEHVTGDTYDDAVKALIDVLKRSNCLDSIIESYVMITEEEYTSIDIVSIDEIKEEHDLDIMEHSLFKKLVNDKERELHEIELAACKRKEDVITEAELKQLAYLKSKYEK